MATTLTKTKRAPPLPPFPAADESWQSTLGYAIPESEPDDLYPGEDDQPMAETDKHQQVISYCIAALAQYFKPVENEVYVAGNNFLYFRPHTATQKPKKVSPDVYVVRGIAQNPPRDSYKVWRENGRLPSVVIEITSTKTAKQDTGAKLALYEQTLKVPEYFLFDPTGGYLNPTLRGYRLDASRTYQMIPVTPLASGNRLYSEELGLYLVGRFDHTLRFLNPLEGKYLLTLDEAITVSENEAVRAEAETRRAEAEGRRAEAEARRADEEARRADEATRLAEELAVQVARERERAETANAEFLAEIARLRAMIRAEGDGT